MQRFPIVQNLDGLKASEFADPEARVDAANVVGRMELSDSLSGILIGAAEAGLPMILKIVPVRRHNGIFIVAAALSSVPADPVHVAKTSDPVQAGAAEFVPIAGPGASLDEVLDVVADRAVAEVEEKSPAGDSAK